MRPVVQERHAVGQRDGRRAVHGDDRGDVFQRFVQRFVDGLFGAHVERGERVVHHEHRGLADHGTGEREALALTAAQRDALLTDARVEAPRQVVHEARAGDFERGVEFVVAEVGRAEQHVLAHRRREQRRVVEGHRHPRA